ncbi:MAG: hypothetical protein HYV27_05735 [Candidatus Hydrogenedentes bacterium]|nr:hypothetical protein [Candidatus Hydrogenedentota bacterium]
MDAMWFGFAPFLVVSMVLFFWGLGTRKHCPDCAKPLPPFISPFTKTRRQWLEGGWVCSHCGCETDHAGNKVQPGVTPSRRTLYVLAGVLLLSAVPAIVLFAVLLRH